MKLFLEALAQIGVTLWHVLPWLAGLGVVFAVLSRWSPLNGGRPWWEKRGLVTDLGYWIFVPIFTRYLRIWVTVLLAIGLYVVGKVSKQQAAIAAAITWVVGALPVVFGALRQG